MLHSHGYEVSSGQLIAPGIPATDEHVLLERLRIPMGRHGTRGTPTRTKPYR